MSDKRYEANIIRATAVEPANNLESTSAPGVWSIDEVVELQKKEKWPTVGNVATSVENVFSTFLYDGTNVAQTITNNIDLTEGGLVWQKMRVSDNDPSDTQDHYLRDTARGGGYRLNSNTANAQFGNDGGITSFNSNGFSLSSGSAGNVNQGNYVSWTFRKQAKFFDIVTYTGNGVNGRDIPHNLGVAPGMIMYKPLSGVGGDGTADAWWVDHRGLNANKSLRLNTTVAEQSNYVYWTTRFDADNLNVSGNVNHNGINYVAYLFAHNDGDGEFGPNQDEDIIKCGSYTESGSEQEITLGFEPQWLMIKSSSASSGWRIFDMMRGFNYSGSASDPFANAQLEANTSGVEANSSPFFKPTPTGFLAPTGFFGNNTVFIYMAIRRPQAAPTAASQVFSIVQNTNTLIDNTKVDFGITPDMHIANRTTSGMSHFITDRLTGGKYMFTNANSAESTALSSFNKEQTTVEYTGTAANDSGTYNHLGWKRSRGYFDVVCYDGDGATSQNVSHNLGVVPEMMWVKRRSGASSAASEWQVYHKDLTNASYYLNLNQSYAQQSNSDRWNSTAPTASVFTVGISDTVNKNTGAPNFTATPYIAYLFATLAGISKVGSFSHTNGSTTDVDCGFTSGARFVLLKRYNDTGSWIVFDSVRGIVAGNDPFLKLDTTDAETTGNDVIDPLSSGFQVASGYLATGNWIFYAIA